MSDHLDGLVQRLQALDAEPVAAHPAVLDELHRALVGELERLAGDAGRATAGASAGQE